MTVGGVDLECPGDGFEIDGVFAGGFGFDARLGEHWLLGAGMNFSLFSKGTISLDAGIHAGYRWSLAGEDGTLEI